MDARQWGWGVKACEGQGRPGGGQLGKKGNIFTTICKTLNNKIKTNRQTKQKINLKKNKKIMS